MAHKTEMRVEWFDVDRENIVYFSNYFRFFTVAEDDLLRSIGLSYGTLREKYGIGFARVEAGCFYRRPTRYGDLIQIETVAKFESRAMLTLVFQVFRKEGGTLLAEGKIQAACVELGSAEMKMISVPEEVKARLIKHGK